MYIHTRSELFRFPAWQKSLHGCSRLVHNSAFNICLAKQTAAKGEAKKMYITKSRNIILLMLLAVK